MELTASINSKFIKPADHQLYWFDKLLLGLLFAFTFHPFIGDIREFATTLSIVILILIWLVKGYVNIERKVLFIIIIINGLLIIQSIYGPLNPVHLIRYPLFFVIYPYLIYRLYGLNALKFIADFVFITSVISLPFWLLQSLSPSIDALMNQLVNYLHGIITWDRWPRSMIIYTIGAPSWSIDFAGFYRNSSLFHEPGALAFWANFAIIINLLRNKKLFSSRNLFLFFITLTTFSTAGYMQLFIITVMYLITIEKLNSVGRLFVLGAFIFLSFMVYTSLEFLQPKIEEHSDEQLDTELEGAYTTGRIIRVRKGLNAISKYPLFGRGISTTSQVRDTYSSIFIGNVGGVIGFTARYGIPISFLFFLYMYKGLYKFGKVYFQKKTLILGLYLSILIAMVGQGTTVFNPFMHLLFYHGLFIQRTDFFNTKLKKLFNAKD